MISYRCWGGVALACAIFPSAAVAAGGQQTGPWTVVYTTNALAVEGVEESTGPQRFTVTLRNISPRSISAIALYLGPQGARAQVDLAFNGHDLAPGSTYGLGLQPEPRALSGSLRVGAVLFSDGGGDGDPDALECLRFARLGDMLESARLLGLLRNLGPFQVDNVNLERTRRSLGPQPKSVQEALAGLVIPRGARGMVQGASATALFSFQTAVALRRSSCDASLDRLTRIPESSSARRAKYLADLTARYQKAASALSEAWTRDMGGLAK
jgi:hypothetical protein